MLGYFQPFLCSLEPEGQKKEVLDGGFHGFFFMCYSNAFNLNPGDKKAPEICHTTKTSTANILQSFYRCVIESVITFSFLCWFGSQSLRNKNVLGRVVNICSKVVGAKQVSLNELYECRVVRKARRIVNDSSHVLAQHFELLPSGRRFRVPKFKTLRTKNSFVPRSILLCNK